MTEEEFDQILGDMHRSSQLYAQELINDLQFELDELLISRIKQRPTIHLFKKKINNSQAILLKASLHLIKQLENNEEIENDIDALLATIESLYQGHHNIIAQYQDALINAHYTYDYHEYFPATNNHTVNVWATEYMMPPLELPLEPPIDQSILGSLMPNNIAASS